MHIIEAYNLEKHKEILDNAPNLKASYIGECAERELKERALRYPGVIEVVKTLEGDWDIKFKDGVIVVVEVKGLALKSIKEHSDKTWTATIADTCYHHRQDRKLPNGETINTRNYVKGSFDLLCIAPFAVTGEWQFYCIENLDLPTIKSKKYTKEQCKYLIRTAIKTRSSDINDNFESLLEKIYKQKCSKDTSMLTTSNSKTLQTQLQAQSLTGQCTSQCSINTAHLSSTQDDSQLKADILTEPPSYLISPPSNYPSMPDRLSG
jgi:hypothetical protein